jgi:hypothetical protein
MTDVPLNVIIPNGVAADTALQQPQYFDVRGKIRLLRDPKEPCTVPGNPKPATDPTRSHIAFAFSGGGIRSAAQCAGVLDAARRDEANSNRIPEDHIKIVSCVSGGGYVGSALMDHQAFHFSQTPNQFNWDGFFDQFRENHGCVFLFCNSLPAY